MTQFWNLVISGLVTGALYAILASGLTLTYTTSGVFNFGQGGVAFAVAYLFFQLSAGFHWPVVWAGIFSILIFAPLLGYGLHRLLFRNLREAPIAARMVATLGLLIALPAFVLWLVALLDSKAHWKLPSVEFVYDLPRLGPDPRKNFTLFSGVNINSDQISMVVAAALTALLLWYVVRHTRLGLEMRATVSRVDLASLRGVDPDRASAMSWILSTTLAGLAGVLLAPLFSLTQLQFQVLVFIAIPAVVLGKLKSIPVALLGGLLLGVAQNLITGYVTLPDTVTGFTTAVPFIILFLLLFLLAVDRGRRAGTTTEERAPVDHLAGIPPWRRRAPWLIAAAALTVYALAFASDFWVGLLAKGLATGLVLMSFTVVTGIGGMVSLAQSSFVLAGAFTAGYLINKGWPFVPALLAGTLVSAVVGVIVALPTRRLGGLPLALATLSLAFVGEDLIFQLPSVSNGSDGWQINAPKLGPIDANKPWILFLLLLALVGLVVGLISNLVSSSSGRAMLAVRSTEAGAATSGMAAGRTKLMIFGISAAVAGFGGVMLAMSTGRVTRLDYPVQLGLVWLATTVTFSIRRPAGALLAGLASVVAPQVLDGIPSSSLFLQVLFGAGAIGLASNPDGALAAVAEARALRRRQAARTSAAGEGQAAPARTAPVQDSGLPQPAAEAADDREVVLRLRDVHAGYGGVEALHGISLTIHRGEVLGLLGGNGAGKSTTCAVIGGLVPVSSGTLEFLGADVTASAAHQRSTGGIYLAPERRGIFPDLTVEENLQLWLRTADERGGAYDAFPILGQRRQQPAGSLSGGEQQMLTLAPALVVPPALLVADEPSLGLAPKIVDQIFEALRQLHDRGTALLIAEEKTRDVLALAEHLALLSVGYITWTGARADVDTEQLASAYLGISSTGPDSEGASGHRSGGGRSVAAATAGSAPPDGS